MVRVVAQLSLEMMFGMFIALAVALAAAGMLVHAHYVALQVEREVGTYANLSGHYAAQMYGQALER